MQGVNPSITVHAYMERGVECRDLTFFVKKKIPDMYCIIDVKLITVYVDDFTYHS
jgi:hypothetical protein